jgi:hypothetical protein
MRLNKPGRFTFKYLNDSAIAAQIAGENLLIPIVDPAPMPPRESVQQTASDWTFLRELADRNFFEVFVHWDKLYFRLPRPQTEKIVLEWGKNLSSFAPRLSTSGQFGIQVVRGYDYKLAQSIVAVLPAISLGTDLDDITERLGSGFIDQLVNLGKNVIRDKPVNNYFEATVLAKSVLKQLLDGLYEGSGSCIGLPKLRAGEVVDIRGLGKRFSGNYRMSKVKHTINSNGYQTQFEVTQKYTSSLLQSLRKKISERLLSNPQQKEYGAVVAIVQNNVDPESLGRVQLSFPHLSDVNLSQWARIASPMAGSSSGIYFLPDIGDEVLVVFKQGYVDEPIVIGRLWNGSSRPPEVNTGLNEKKVIRLNSGMQIMFDETPGLEKISIKVDEANFIEVSRTGVKVKGTLIELN